MKKQFCEKCGKEEKKTYWDERDGRYDSKTGKKIMEYQCVNPECPWGCESQGGHFYDFNPFYIFSGSRCKRCGHVDFPAIGGTS